MYVTSGVHPWAVEDRIGLRDARMAFSALLAPAPHEPVEVRAGVLLSGDSEGFDGSCHTGLRVQAAQSMSLTVERGSCVIATKDGPYVCTLDTTARLRLEPASRYMSRVDLVVARVYDDLSETLCPSKQRRHFCIEVWTGDPSPTTPAMPEPDGIGWIPLANIRVPADTTQLTQEHIFGQAKPILPKSSQNAEKSRWHPSGRSPKIHIGARKSPLTCTYVPISGLSPRSG
ncbi:hypothetical protein ACH347_30040 [Saccharopolyspora sp. 5N102]|uniref:hypothetical protein n=1 Tax=Saccharopolyspora sp. 5N102 TaxID=3375155 RepID=UPI00378D767D